MKLKLAENLSLPLDAVTQTFLVVGKRGSGKSNTAARFVEQLYHAKLPFVVLDPVDTWWGLKAGRDGGNGLDVYVFGGRKADLPLEAGGGALIAEVLCEHRLSMVLSVKHLSGRERSGFMVAFAQTLFQKWGGGPLHVVLEEAHELAPQMSGSQSSRGNVDNEAAMLGAFKRLWKLGRSSGIGGTAVTQRPASLSKDITTQSEILIAHRTIGPQDVKAIGEWVKYHGEQGEILADLPTLPTGEAFVWAPEFPEGHAIGLKRTTVLLRETYDSASTPKVGEQRVEPKELATVDLERLRTKMAATIEKAKADDPRELRKQIAELKKQLGSKADPAGKTSLPTGKPVPVMTDADRALLEKLVARIETAMSLQHEDLVLAGERLKNALHLVGAEYNASVADVTAKAQGQMQALFDAVSVQKLFGKLAAVQPQQNTHATMTQRVGRQVPVSPQARRVAPAPATSRPARLVSEAADGDASIGNSGLRRMLIALAQRQQGLTRSQLGIRAQVSVKGGSFNTYLSKARVNGWVDSTGDRIVITDAGLAALGQYDPLPEGAELLNHYVTELGSSGAGRMLVALANVYPRTMTRAELSEASQVSAAGGSFNTYLSKLRTLELVEGKTELRASDELFSLTGAHR